MAIESDLTVAVTGPTGTFGFGLVPLLQDDDRVARVVGVARRPFDPEVHGWTKMRYRQGDVRDPDALETAFAGADVVVHLAFLIVGGDQETTRGINVEGTLNAFRAAAAAGARRFVYASSVAAYGFHADNPVGLTEDWPTRPAARLFYAQEKAELEQLLAEESAQHPEIDLYLLRPPIVVGPHAVGGKSLPTLLAPLVGLVERGRRRLPFPVPVVVPDLPVQLIHEEDVGRALLQCVVGGRARWCLQHRGRRRPQHGRRRPGAGPAAAPGARGAGPGGRQARVPPPAAAVVGPVGRGRQPPGDHGHLEGPRPAGLDAPHLRPAGDPRLSRIGSPS